MTHRSPVPSGSSTAVKVFATGKLITHSRTAPVCSPSIFYQVVYQRKESAVT
jgi:hypothetical protein